MFVEMYGRLTCPYCIRAKALAEKMKSELSELSDFDFKFVNMPEEGIDLNNKPEQLTDADKWILSKLNTLVKDVTDNMEKYELGIAADKIYEFIWEEFCDWYIEMVKPRL